MNYITILSRITLSLVLGFLIGLERQLTRHPAGIRINVLICMGTCFFTLFPIVMSSDQVFRVGASIISGVGFLCSGVIFKDNTSVRGMNTAATLWCTAAIGILSSTGSYFISISATCILILSNLILRPLAQRITPGGISDEVEREYKVSITCFEDGEEEIRKLLINSIPGSKTLFLSKVESGDVVGEKVEVCATYLSMGKPKIRVLEDIVGHTLTNSKVVSAGWEIMQC